MLATHRASIRNAFRRRRGALDSKCDNGQRGTPLSLDWKFHTKRSSLGVRLLAKHRFFQYHALFDPFGTIVPNCARGRIHRTFPSSGKSNQFAICKRVPWPPIFLKGEADKRFSDSCTNSYQMPCRPIPAELCFGSIMGVSVQLAAVDLRGRS
jgi:hypothetical protein